MIKTMTETKQCTHIGDDGQQCRAWARHDKEYCFRHDPESREVSIEASRRGGLAREIAVETPLEAIPVSTAKDVVTLITRTINEVRAGTLDPRIANTIGYLAGHLIRAFEVAELEGKVEEVRAVLIGRKPIKKG